MLNTICCYKFINLTAEYYDDAIDSQRQIPTGDFGYR